MEVFAMWKLQNGRSEGPAGRGGGGYEGTRNARPRKPHGSLMEGGSTRRHRKLLSPLYFFSSSHSSRGGRRHKSPSPELRGYERQAGWKKAKTYNKSSSY